MHCTNNTNGSRNEACVKKIKIYIIEDSVIERAGLRYVINKHKHMHVIGESDSCLNALTQISSKSPDVVVTDIGNEFIDGMAAPQKIKSLYPDIKCVVLTNSKKEKDLYEALNAGAEAYCSKNSSSDDLTNAIHCAARGICWIDSSVSKFAYKLFTKQENLPYFPIDMPIEEQLHLSAREEEVLRLMVAGKKNTEIAKELVISIHTAKAHVANILEKFGVPDRIKAIVTAIRDYGY